jgi:hypothetical protein
VAAEIWIADWSAADLNALLVRRISIATLTSGVVCTPTYKGCKLMQADEMRNCCVGFANML